MQFRSTLNVKFRWGGFSSLFPTAGWPPECSTERPTWRPPCPADVASSWRKRNVSVKWSSREGKYSVESTRTWWVNGHGHVRSFWHRHDDNNTTWRSSLNSVINKVWRLPREQIPTVELHLIDGVYSNMAVLEQFYIHYASSCLYLDCSITQKPEHRTHLHSWP